MGLTTKVHSGDDCIASNRKEALMALGGDEQTAGKQSALSALPSRESSNTNRHPLPTISLPKGGGAIRSIGEKFAANPVTGTGSMTVPIATSPGRSDFGPQLSLSYDSGVGNGAFGFGWHLTLPAITRKTDKGLPQYRDSEETDAFILSGSEDLVPLLATENNQWKRRISPPRTLDDGTTYWINYCNRTPRQGGEDLTLRSDWLFEVVFDYDEGHYEALPADVERRQFVRAMKDKTRDWSVRQDPFSSYRASFEVRTYRLCQRVLMFHHFEQELGIQDYLVKSTDFEYRQIPIGSFITSISQSGYRWNSAEGKYIRKSLPPLQFTYTEANIDDTIRTIDADSLENLPYGLDGSHYQWVDLDSEGLSGILTEQADGWFYKRNLSALPGGDGNGNADFTARFAPVELVAAKPSLADLNGGRQQLMDLAGEGPLDLVQFSGPMRGVYN